MKPKVRLRVREIAKTLGVSYRSIYRDCQRLGIQVQGGYKAGLRPTEAAKVIEKRIARSA